MSIRARRDRPRLRSRRARAVAVVAVMALVASSGGPVAAQEPARYPDTRRDAYYSEALEALAQDGVFVGTDCDEGFCPDEPIDRATMAVWTVRVLDAADPAPVSSTRFMDVDASHPHAAFIERFAETGVTKGCGDGTRFCPDDSVTRAEMAVFLSRAFSLSEGPDPGFSDVPPDAWYAPDVHKLAASGVTKGCGDGTHFCPDQPTARAQMATFLFRAQGLTDTSGTVETGPTAPATYRILDARSNHGCAILTNDTITCWGWNDDGTANAPAGTYKSLATGSYHNCAIATDDTITCWGKNWEGESDPPAGTYKMVTVSDWFHSCAIATDDTITCWGKNDDGKADAPAGTYKTLTTSSFHNCAVATDDTITCWGDNHNGRTDAPAGTYRTVVAGRYHNCAIRTEGTITCWGVYCGTRTDGTYGCWRANRNPAGTYKTVATGSSHNCAVATNDTITCWGNNEHGQTDAPAGTYKTVATGSGHNCAIATDGTIACWGNNEHGQADAPAGTYNSVTAIWRHSCAIATNDTVTCWGDNEHGRADPPQTMLEVSATQPIAPADLSARSVGDHVSRDVLDFDMIDASTGATVNLRSVVNGRTPLLFWLYSPY